MYDGVGRVADDRGCARCEEPRGEPLRAAVWVVEAGACARGSCQHAQGDDWCDVL
jgi:hypothetical protein